MSSSLLHQAVELAQAGQREDARRILLQFVQTEPNNEVAWLWLASVAADQTEYQRALNEVLRVNPTNQRALQLLTEFEQQQAGPPTYTPPQVDLPPADQTQAAEPPPYSEPYSAPPSATPQSVSDIWPKSAAPPPPSDQLPQYAAPPPPPPAQPMQQPYAQMQPIQGVEPQQVIIERERVIEKRRGRGCLGCGFPGCFGCLGCGGCGQGCLLALVLMVIAPILACGILSYTANSLGPLDLFLGYLPDEFGRKNIEFQTTDYSEFSTDVAVKVKVPRSWFLVDKDSPWWQATSEMLDGVVPFDQDSRNWTHAELQAVKYPVILDMNPAHLTEGGNVIRMDISGQTVGGDYACATIKGEHGDNTVEYDGDLCGYRVDSVYAGPGSRVFREVDPPVQIHDIMFYTPIDTGRAFEWTITMPEVIYERYEAHIEALIESVEIE